jgi:hypothetical protein
VRTSVRLIAEADWDDADLAAFMDAALADIDREGGV